MRALASMAMRGRMQAAMLAGTFAVLALVIPPVGVLSSAVIGLVALREGQRAGLWVLVAAALGCGLLAAVVFGNPLPVLGYVLMLWLPVWILALVLRATRSLAIAVQVALLFGLMFVAVYYLQTSDPEVAWQQVLKPLSDAIDEAGMLEPDQREAVMAELARWMTGLLGAGLFLQLVASLFVARWWQAMLYNPGGFRAEFHGLRLGKTLAYLALPPLAVIVFGLGTDWQLARYLAILVLSAYVVQGLAVVHGVVGKRGAHPAWLYAMYVLLFFAMPQMGLALALAGYLDTWFDFRSRVQAPKK